MAWRLGAMGPRRRVAAGAVVLLVCLVHLWLAERIREARLDFGAGEQAMARMQVAFVRELKPAAPARVGPPPSAAVAPVPRPTAALAAADAASAPARKAVDEEARRRQPDKPEPLVPPEAPPPESLPLPKPESDAAALEKLLPPPLAAPAPEALASAPAAAAAPVVPHAATPVAGAASAAALAGFDWPASTRLSYELTGNYRGEVAGSATVEWLRRGPRYQVHVEVVIGPRFAPLMSRRMSSEGLLGAQGLQPQRYEEETRQVLRDPRRRAIQFQAGRVLLPGGRIRDAVPGLQDSASQFVQLTYLFTLQPELLRAGAQVEVPLALPTSVDGWIYEVRERETLYTPVGPIETWPVRPRREAKPGGDLVAEVWIAPSLQYLPVRIRIRQDAETFVDLMLDRAPQQGDAGK